MAESVVVIKKLLQMQPEKHSDIIKHMAKLTDNIQVRGLYSQKRVFCMENTMGSCMSCSIDIYFNKT